MHTHSLFHDFSMVHVTEFLHKDTDKLSTEYSKCFCFIFTGLAYVCEGLKEQRKGLVTLVLWNNQLTHNGMGYLAAALV